VSDKSVFFEIFGVQVQFGWNALSTLGPYAGKNNAKKALIVTDSGVAAAGIPEQIVAALKSAGIDSVIFDGVSENPTDTNVEIGAKQYKEASCDLIIGLGGGSPMDAAKGIRVLVSHPEPLHRYLDIKGGDNIVNPMPTLIDIPTTSGTGSETSRGAVITDTEQRRKRVLRSGMPSLALVDPALTASMPPKLTAATGMDALSHCIEAYLSPQYHPAAEAVAFEGIRLVAENLPNAVEDGSNKEARTQMAMASSMGALAFQKGLGATHSLSHQLSSEFGIHHGVANALLLPHTMTFNLDLTKDKMRRIAFAMGETSLEPEAAAAAVAALNKKIGLPEKLSELNVSEEGIAIMARNAMMDWCHPNNPRPCTEEDMKTLFLNAM
jgi:4-hydroxybutyrate dehydrogenase